MGKERIENFVKMRWGGGMRGREREGEERVEKFEVGNWEICYSYA